MQTPELPSTWRARRLDIISLETYRTPTVQRLPRHRRIRDAALLLHCVADRSAVASLNDVAVINILQPTGGRCLDRPMANWKIALQQAQRSYPSISALLMLRPSLCFLPDWGLV